MTDDLTMIQTMPTFRVSRVLPALGLMVALLGLRGLTTGMGLIGGVALASGALLMAGSSAALIRANTPPRG